MSPVDVRRGTALAALAALAFGVTAPVLAVAGRGAQPFAVASLLYAGAAGASLLVGARPGRAIRARAPLGWLLAMVLAGAVVAPTAFVWGILETGATTGSLLLNLESLFTVLLAAAILGERIGRRVALAVAVMGAGGVLLTMEVLDQPATAAPLGALAVVVATASWGLDNVLARKLERLEALDVVMLKSALGAAITGSCALLLRGAWPERSGVAILLACGGIGYGVSLALYLAAQRRMGAARTGSVFAIAPFVGALVAYATGSREVSWPTGVAAALFGLGVFLHATERRVERAGLAPGSPADP